MKLLHFVILSLCCLYLSTTVYGQSPIMIFESQVRRAPRTDEELEKRVQKAKQQKNYVLCGDLYREKHYRHNSKERDKADKKAFRFYQKATRSGSGKGWHRMAYMYHYGKGTKKDITACREALKQAVEKEYWPAVFNLVELYFNGSSLGHIYPQNADKVERYSLLLVHNSDNKAFKSFAMNRLARIYLIPEHSKDGQKLNLKFGLQWAQRLKGIPTYNIDQQLHTVYDILSNHHKLYSWTQKYPHFIPDLTIDSVYTDLKKMEKTLNILSKTLRSLDDNYQTQLHEQFFKSFLHSMPSEPSMSKMEEYLKSIEQHINNYPTTIKLKQKLTDLGGQRCLMLEANLVGQYNVGTLSQYLASCVNRLKIYRKMGATNLPKLQEVMLALIVPEDLNNKQLETVLSILVNTEAFDDNDATVLALFTSAEQQLNKHIATQTPNTFLDQLTARWKHYPKSYQQRALDTYQFIYNSTEQIHKNHVVSKLIAISSKHYLTPHLLEKEIGTLLKTGKTLNLDLKRALELEKELYWIHRDLAHQAFLKNYTSPNDWQCSSQQHYDQAKREYYKQYRNRIQDIYNGKINHLFIRFLVEQESFLIESELKSFHHLFVFVNEFLIKLHKTTQDDLLRILKSYKNDAFCRAMHYTGRIRLQTLIDENAYFTIKWHMENTSPNLIPQWSNAVKNVCSFCALETEKLPNSHTAPKYQSYSALAYAEEKGNTALIAKLKSLGAKEEIRDTRRMGLLAEENKRIEAEKRKKAEEEQQELVERKRRQEQADREKAAHLKMIHTLRVGDCIVADEGSYDFYSGWNFGGERTHTEYKAIVTGRLVSVSNNEHGSSFIKVTSVRVLYRERTQWKRNNKIDSHTWRKWKTHSRIPYMIEDKELVGKEIMVYNFRLKRKC